MQLRAQALGLAARGGRGCRRRLQVALALGGFAEQVFPARHFPGERRLHAFPARPFLGERRLHLAKTCVALPGFAQEAVIEGPLLGERSLRFAQASVALRDLVQHAFEARPLRVERFAHHGAAGGTA